MIKTVDDLKDYNIDCILILGAGIWGNRPSYILEDRLLEGANLYNKKIAPKIIVSGNHRDEEYNEVKVMKDFLIAKGIPNQDIFMDHAGSSTYDSIYRAKYIFKVKKIVIVTQQYHLYRSIYIAKKLIDESNEIIGHFYCQGKMPISIRNRYEKALQENPNDERMKNNIENFDKALEHPNKEDLENFELAIDEAIKNKM